jgi:N-acyl-D-amino-acid deacylase
MRRGRARNAGELEHLCRIVARSGKLYATHMRSYSDGLLEAVREQLDLARATGCRLQISHLQAAGRANWGLQQRALDEIEAARAEGIDVEFDIYPYQCGSTVLTQWLPGWALEGGRARC